MLVWISSTRTPVLMNQRSPGVHRFSAKNAKLLRPSTKGASPVAFSTKSFLNWSRSYSNPATRVSFAATAISLRVLATIRKLFVNEFSFGGGESNVMRSVETFTVVTCWNRDETCSVSCAWYPNKFWFWCVLGSSPGNKLSGSEPYGPGKPTTPASPKKFTLNLRRGEREYPKLTVDVWLR